MSLPGHPDLQSEVVTTATHVSNAFQEMVAREMPGTEVVYDEQLVFETAIKSYLNRNNFNGNDTLKTDYPVFFYNRSQLRWPQGVAPSRRLNVMTGVLNLGAGKGVKYRATQGEFDIQFMCLCRDVETQEKFEVAYQGEQGISANRALELNMGNALGKFNYFLTYSELTQKSIVYNEVAYTATMGQLTARGLYFTLIGAAALIKTLNLKVYVKLQPAGQNQLDFSKTINI